MAKIIRAKYEKGVLKPLEKLDLEEGEEVIVRIEKVKGKEMHRDAVERFYGVLGPAPKELLDEFMMEAETG